MYPRPFVLFENTIRETGVPLHPKYVKIVEIKFNEMYYHFYEMYSPLSLANNCWSHKLRVAGIYCEMVPNATL